MRLFIGFVLLFALWPWASSFAQSTGSSSHGGGVVGGGGGGFSTGYTPPGSDASFALLLLAVSVFIFSCYLLMESYKFTRLITIGLNEEQKQAVTGIKSTQPKPIIPIELFILIVALAVMVTLWLLRWNIIIKNTTTGDLILDILSMPSSFVHLPLVMSSLVSALSLARFLLAMFIVRTYQAEPDFPVKSVGTPVIGLLMAAITLVGSIASILGMALNIW